jgi:hypothetical protein
MNEPKLVESQLHCRANASLNASIIEDLEKEDRPLESLLLDEGKKDESSTTATKQLPSEIRN